MTHRGAQTALHTSNSLVPPRLDEDVEDIPVDLRPSIFHELSLELHARFSDLRPDVPEWS